MKIKNIIKHLTILHKIHIVQKKLKYLDLCINSSVYKKIENVLNTYKDDNDYFINQCFNVDGKYYIYISVVDSVFISKQNKSIVYRWRFEANFTTDLPDELNKIDLSSLPKLRLNSCFNKDDDIRFKFCSFSTIHDSLIAELEILQNELKML